MSRFTTSPCQWIGLIDGYDSGDPLDMYFHIIHWEKMCQYKIGGMLAFCKEFDRWREKRVFLSVICSHSFRGCSLGGWRSRWWWRAWPMTVTAKTLSEKFRCGRALLRWRRSFLLAFAGWTRWRRWWGRRWRGRGGRRSMIVTRSPRCRRTTRVIVSSSMWWNKRRIALPAWSRSGSTSWTRMTMSRRRLSQFGFTCVPFFVLSLLTFTLLIFILLN